MLYSIVGMLVIILDQLVKFAVDRNINWTNPTRTVIPGVLSLVRVQNDGAAFSFLSGSNARIWFIVITGIFAVLVVLALATNFVSGKFGRWCLVFVTAGGLANMIDRIRYGYVIDMFKIELFDFAVFNVADIFISVFCIAFIIYILFGGEKQKDTGADEFDDYDYEEEDRPAKPSFKKSRKRSYEDDYDYEEDEPRRNVKKKGSRKADYDEEEYYEEELPRKRSERSAAAAAKAYGKAASYEEQEAYSGRRAAPADTDARTRTRSSDSSAVRNAGKKRSRSEEEEMAELFSGSESRASARSGKAPAASAERRVSGSSAAQRGAADASVRRSSSAQGNTSAQQRTAATAQRSFSSASSVSSNPFAEWEEANQRVSERQSFSNLQEEPTAAAPSHRSNTAAGEGNRSSAASVKASASASDDFDLDAILNEFK